MQVLVIINKNGIKINAGVNVKNPSNYNCECNKSCNVGKYLDHKNCKCRKKVVDLLVEKCDKNVNETLSEISLNDYKCDSCRP